MAAPDIDHIVYPVPEPVRTFRFPVGDGHELHVEEIGNPAGRPAVVLHGGPGSRIEDRHRRLFDPERYRLIAFDQRGAGRSTPRGEIRNNTTWHLVDDIEALRRHLAIEEWLVVGGSWGSTLALLYAQTHPASVTGIVVWSVWLADSMSRRWFFEFGANMVRPEAWEEFVGHFTMEERDDLEAAVYRRIGGSDPVAAAAAARALGEWETSMVYFHAREGGLADISGADHAENYGRILSHYFENRCFLDGDDHVLSRCAAIGNIPGTIVQGRYDMCTPVREAWHLKQAWPRADLRIVEHGGHMTDEPNMAAAMVEALDAMADRP